jgi:hypothetical protein
MPQKACDTLSVASLSPDTCLRAVATFTRTRARRWRQPVTSVSIGLPAAFLLELCQSVPVDTPKDLKTSLQQNPEPLRLAICKRIEQLDGELPMNWLDCELIYLERFAQKLQRRLDRKVIGF